MLDADAEPIQIGKLQDRFLSDERGRRIYFPPIGPARLVPSREVEAKFRERTFFTNLSYLVPLVAAQMVGVFWPERWLLHVLLLGCTMLLIALVVLSGRLFAWNWPALPASDCSYDQCVMEIYARRSIFLLVPTALLHTAWLISLMAAPVLAAYGILAMDLGTKGYDLIPPMLLVAVLLPLAWLGARRAIRALLIRLHGRNA